MADLLTLNDKVGDYPPSYYAATAGAGPIGDPLDGDLTTDVCIIGAGLAGLSAALTLSTHGLDVLVLDASRVGFGASGRNGGQLGTGLRKSQEDLEHMLGPGPARAIWDMTEDAKATVRGYLADHDIACDLKQGQLHAMLSAAGAREAAHEAEHLATTYGYDQMHPLDRDGIRAELKSDFYAGGALDMGAGHLHPLNFALGMARAAEANGVRIAERTRVTTVTPGSPNRVTTDRGTIQARKVLYALNGYNQGVEPQAAAHVMPINNFIVATEPLGDLAAELIPRDVCVADSKFVVNYYRLSADKRMLFGGGETYSYKFPADIPALVRPNMEQVFPDLKGVKVDHAWGGTLGITMNRLPFMRALDETRLSVGGFSGQGVAMATQAGKLMALSVLGAHEGFASFEQIAHRAFPGGTAFRHPLLVMAMTWYALRDRLGV